MLIKIIMTPNNKFTWDLGTSYIETTNEDFIEGLKNIGDFEVMGCYLDANTKYYKEHLYPRPRYDFDEEIDLTKSFYKHLNYKSLL